MTILKNNHKSGINENNIKVAIATEEQQVQSRALPLLPLPTDYPIRAEAQVYQVSTTGVISYPDHPECSSQSHIFCKVTVTAGAKFKSISKALLKIEKHGGNESGDFGVCEASEDMVALHAHHTNYLKTVTQNGTTYAVIDITEHVKSGESKVFYLAIRSEDGSMLFLNKTGSVELSYVEDDDLIPSGKLEKQVGAKGGYAINARNGKLQYNQRIFTFKGGLMPFGMSLSYNATNCDSSSPNGVANGMKGWTFNYQQSLMTGIGKMLYVDASNVVHTFRNPTNNSSVWYDATGKNGMVLVATDAGYSMSDGKTTTLNFDTSKRLVSVEQKLSSSKTVATAIEYASDGKISKVTNGLGDAYNFTWTDTLIQVKKEITVEDTLTETLLTEITLADERIMQIKYCLSGDTVDFTYDENNQLIFVLDSASHQKAVFEYNEVGAISAVKNYISETTDVATDSNHFEYKLLQTHIASCRNSEVKSNAYCTMAYLFAEDGELLTTAEVKGSSLQPLRYRTKQDFEKSSGTIPDKELAKALFDGEETVYATASATSDEFTLNTQNQVFNTHLFSASACIDTADYIAGDNQVLTVQILEDNTVIGFAEFDPSKREAETVCGTFTLSPGVHTLKAKLAISSNLKADVSFGYVKLYSTKNGVQKQYVNVETGDAMATEHDGSAETPWYEQGYCSLYQDDTVVVEDVIFNAKDYALTLISRLQNPTAYNVWYNDGKNMLYQVSGITLEWSNNATKALDQLTVCTLSSTLGKTMFEYLVPDSTHLYKARKVTTVSADDALDGVVAEEFVNSNFQTVKVVDEHGITTEYTHDSNGSVTKVVTTAPTGTLLNIEENSTYNDHNLLATSKHRRYLVDYTQSYTYGDDYELTEETQPNSQATSFAYSADKDKLTRISATLDSSTSQNNISYDGDLVDTLSDTRTVVDFAYDERHNISQVTIAGTTVLSKEITYNEYGTTQSVTTYGNGQKVKKYYDKFDRLIKVSDVTATESVLVQYIYNDDEIDKSTFSVATFTPTISANSLLRVVVDNIAGTTTWYNYDEFGRFIECYHDSLCITQAYDEYGRIYGRGRNIDPGTSIGTNIYTYASPVDDTIVSETTMCNAGTLTSTYTKDVLKRPFETTVMHGDYGCKNTFTYVPRQDRTWVVDDGPIQVIKSTSADATAITPAIGHWEVDDVGTTNYVAAFKEYSISGDTATLVRTDSITYDANGNITKYGDVTYEYDKLGRLIRENNPILGIDKTVVWCYDIGGNIVSKTEYAYTTGTVGTPINTITYAYSASWKDQLTSFNGQSITYDQSGNPTSYKGATLIWERGRNLASYYIPGDGEYFDMKYSADGKRVEKRKSYDDETSDYVTTYMYDGNNLISETSDDGSSTKSKHYLYNSQGIIGFVYLNEVYTYRKNLFGDIVAIYSGSTKLVEYAYDAYGNCTIVTDTGNIGYMNPFRYRGYYWDRDLNLYYLMSRYYDPQVGRFINADSLEYLDPETIGGLNLYAYCGNNPIMYADPSGHFIVWAIIIAATIIGGVIGAVAGDSQGKTGWDLAESILKGAVLGAMIAGTTIMIAGIGVGFIVGSFKLAILGTLTASNIIGTGMFAAGVAMYISNTFWGSDFQFFEWIGSYTPDTPKNNTPLPNFDK